jgi:putative ABC transport system permease protein
VGDKIALAGDIYPVDLEMTLYGIFDAPEMTDTEELFFHWTYLDELLKRNRNAAAGQIGVVMVKGQSADALPQLMQRIERRFASSEAPVRAMTEQAFQNSFIEMAGNVKAFVRNTALAIVFSLVCVAGNAMAMSLRERTREVAVLKAIGFPRRTVLGLVLGEAMAIALVGGGLGVLAARLLPVAIDMGGLGVPGLSLFYIPWYTMLLGLALAVFIGLAAGIVPAWRVAQISVVDGLRRVV